MRKLPVGVVNRPGFGPRNGDHTYYEFGFENSGLRTRSRDNKFMNQALLDKIESEQFRKNAVDFAVGDTVRVHTKVVEGDKERIQIFSGVVIGRRGRGLNEMFT